MKVLRISTQLHKWVGLVVGVQVLFWVLGGLVMTAIPIERVRSEHHVASAKGTPLDLAALLPADRAAALAGVSPVEAQLKSTPRGPVWSFKVGEGEPVVVSALDGRPLPPLRELEAMRLAQAAYKGEGRAVTARYLASPPQETGRETPLWRVDFDDAERTAFYLSPQTAEVVTRRSAVWRFYDFFWRLHIMDLQNGEDFNHPLIIVCALLALSIVITGFVLLWCRLARDLKAAMAVRAARR